MFEIHAPFTLSMITVTEGEEESSLKAGKSVFCPFQSVKKGLRYFREIFTRKEMEKKKRKTSILCDVSVQMLTSQPSGSWIRTQVFPLEGETERQRLMRERKRNPLSRRCAVFKRLSLVSWSWKHLFPGLTIGRRRRQVQTICVSDVEWNCG